MLFSEIMTNAVAECYVVVDLMLTRMQLFASEGGLACISRECCDITAYFEVVPPMHAVGRSADACSIC